MERYATTASCLVSNECGLFDLGVLVFSSELWCAEWSCGPHLSNELRAAPPLARPQQDPSEGGFLSVEGGVLQVVSD
eukprot:scaffold71641_cov36-Tisochrysis_lutea.AAC.4